MCPLSIFSRKFPVDDTDKTASSQGSPAATSFLSNTEKLTARFVFYAACHNGYNHSDRSKSTHPKDLYFINL